jgi:hypothetical protein
LDRDLNEGPALGSLGDFAAAQDDGAGMKVQAAHRILKRACTAKVMEAVFFEEAANFGGPVGRGFGGGQPAFDFRSEVVSGGDGVDFEPCVAKEMQEFADRQCAHV